MEVNAKWESRPPLECATKHSYIIRRQWAGWDVTHSGVLSKYGGSQQKQQRQRLAAPFDSELKLFVCVCVCVEESREKDFQVFTPTDYLVRGIT
jgi:hypothetical protein